MNEIHAYLMNALQYLLDSQISVDAIVHSGWTYAGLYALLLLTMGRTSTLRVLTEFWINEGDLRRPLGSYEYPNNLTEADVQKMIGLAFKTNQYFYIFMVGAVTLFSPVVSLVRIGINTVYYPVSLVGRVMFHAESK